MKKRLDNYSLYQRIHYWMKTKYGKPKICENCGVTNSARYEWAKLPDYDYDFKKENFIRLCKSCHVRMDMANDENWAINISNGLKNVYLNKPNSMTGKKHSEATKNKISEMHLQYWKNNPVRKPPYNKGVKKIMPLQLCGGCKSNFTPKKLKQTFCSNKCSHKGNINRVYTEENRKKASLRLSEFNKKRFKIIEDGKPKYIRTISTETRKKIADALSKHWQLKKLKDN